jgi:hypothetical protein
VKPELLRRTLPNSLALGKTGIEPGPDSGAVQKIIVLLYNADTPTRTLQLGEGGLG